MGGSSAGTGRTAAGVFRVPRTPDMFETLALPSHWGAAEVVVLVVMGFNLSLALLRAHLPLAVYVATFLFWRACYNVGLGLILRAQSRRQAVTRWLADAPRGTRDLVRWAVTASLPADYAWPRVPVEYNAWVAYRALAMLVLANDGLSYLVLCAACFRPWAESSALVLVVCNAVGAALIAFSVWAKAAAHRCVGDFGWYWGDFFFTMEGELTFDGVFELFPHPMYTVGYSAYYGLSLITRSYTLLSVSLIAHAAQIAFLVLVEEPHIQKVYASPPAPPAPALPASPYAAPAVGLRNLSPLRPGDAALVISLATTAACAAVAPAALPPALLLWRAVHWLGLARVLASQARDNAYLSTAAARGIPPAAAFDAWTQLWNMSTVMNHVLFPLAALYLAPPSPSALLTARGLAHALLGLALTSIALLSTHAAHTPHAYFHAHAFFPPPSPTPAHYPGPRRYVSHPDATLTYLAHYGLAISLSSPRVFLLALLSQAAHAAFTLHVEAPLLARVTQHARPAAPAERALLAAAGTLDALLPDTVRAQAARSRGLVDAPGRAVESVRGQLALSRGALAAEVQALNVRLRKHRLVLRAAELRDEASEAWHAFDGGALVAELERRGVAIERCEDDGSSAGSSD